MFFRRALSALAVLAAAVAVPLAVPGQAHAAPNFKAPFACGQKWTYSHHSAEVRRALDFVRSDGGTTSGAPVLASAGGTATRMSQPDGAGNYIVIDHGGGWKTYYFHLASYSVASGTYVSQGRQIGTTGSTGNSSGPHIHYEQLYNGVGQDIRINGSALPYPSSYGQYHLTSDNGCSSGGTAFRTWGSDVRVRADAYLSSAVVGSLSGPTDVVVVCQKQGDTVSAEGYTNNWWSKLRDQGGFITNIYIDHPDAKLPGVPLC
ncbi:M23 family metallopeptidase [Streptomyces sp. NPDC059506]|uniref:M23 family metallopeptidase n=1 Tax=Streptomyces TaxID=1883 RepID=UPI000CA90392|nr:MULTISPECIES: M23 family metallopeptidase [unclassified Streptomyces]MCZ2525160.1 M23 family metallopeptidase [Streptomyces sp. HB2AG]PLW71361.1 peptidase M23 [Streptomyces sp. DJ]QMV23640.1 peptidoglycan DD-metalloendopeptidase family protein [Streptomyces sp. SCUT-3]